MENDLFGEEEQAKAPAGPSWPEQDERHLDDRPLAERLRPRSLGGYLGQSALLGEGAPLARLIKADRIPSMILWGPPGSGKTTLARLIAQETSRDFVTLSAVTSGVRDVRQVIDVAKSNRKFGRSTILFIDEIHRFNKAQQDGFLPHVESGLITLIGATTENPSFSVISPLLSRCRVYTLKSLSEDDQMTLLRRGVERLNEERDDDSQALEVSDDALQAIVGLSDGDARRALGMLEIADSLRRDGESNGPVSVEDVKALSQRQLVYDKSGEEHFNIISALHKTVRSSDPHGALYWLGRMLAAGEDPLYIARRLVRMAVEDIGMADPFALSHSMEALRAYQALGSPEGELALQQATVYLAVAPKSNAVYTAGKEVAAEIQASGSLPVPLHLRNAPTKLMKDLGYSENYSYDHEGDGHFIAKQGLPDDIQDKKFYRPSREGREKGIAEKLEEWDAARDELRKK